MVILNEVTILTLIHYIENVFEFVRKKVVIA